ncbi:MAG: hypothetical protein JSV79_03350 [Armatimonadota bacterium]|nr:MAG: hypothetical protein JSV79_03350 [Armatimonadota bacterium]
MPFGLPESYWVLFVAALVVTLALLLLLSVRRTRTVASALVRADDEMTEWMTRLDDTLRQEDQQRAAERERRLNEWMGVLQHAAEEREERRQAENHGFMMDQFNMLQSRVRPFFEGAQRTWHQMAGDLAVLREETQQLRQAAIGLRTQGIQVPTLPEDPFADAAWARRRFRHLLRLERCTISQRAGIRRAEATALAANLKKAVNRRVPAQMQWFFIDLVTELYRPFREPPRPNLTPTMAETAVFLWASPNSHPQPSLRLYTRSNNQPGVQVTDLREQAELVAELLGAD